MNIKKYLDAAIGSNGEVPLDPPKEIKELLSKSEAGREAMMNAETDEERERIGEEMLDMLLKAVEQAVKGAPAEARAMMIMISETQRKLSMLDCKRAGHPEIILRRLIN